MRAREAGVTMVADDCGSALETLDRICAGLGDLRPVPRVVVVAAHPDDEVVGLGGQLPRLREGVFVHVTDGAPRDGQDAAAHGFASPADYARARRAELLAALAVGGIGPDRTRELGCPDQGATARMRPLAEQLTGMLTDLRPQAVITHPYEGGHPDHDATAFAVHAAVRLLAPRGMSIELLEMSSYHQGPTGIESSCFLPCAERCCVPRVVQLTPAQRELKRRMLACFVTQAQTLRYFPVEIETLRVAPRYDFASPPHAGRLFYEHFPWGTTGEQFRRLAEQAQRELGLEGPL